MKFITAHFTSFIRAFKLLAILLVCSLYIALNSTTALAFGGASSSPSEGAAQLDDVYEESVKAANPNANPRSMKEVQAKAEKGINAVQGRADFDKMKHPQNSEGSTVKDDIKDAASSLFGN